MGFRNRNDPYDNTFDFIYHSVYETVLATSKPDPATSTARIV